jgi:thiamine biosynthesis lipoprotein
LLGTMVAIRVEADDAAAGHRAIDAAFDAVARVHALMSFHEAASDLSRIHRAPVGTRVEVDPQTAEVLRSALAFSAWSDGAFDITVADHLVAQGLLPAPALASAPSAAASWRDVQLDDACGVIVRQPLWMDLGGIAKGYAVDRAVESLRESGIRSACVNAGGDLRLLGQGPHRVAIHPGNDHCARKPIVEIDEGAIATSTSRALAQTGRSAHVHGRTRKNMGTQMCVSVAAETCMYADALTKIVLASGTASAPLLERLNATAYLHDADDQWSVLGIAA